MPSRVRPTISRAAVLGAVAGVAVLAAPGAAAGMPATSSSSTSTSKAPRLAATLASCGTGTSERGRSAAFRGTMPRRTGASRLWMRFDLERRRPGSTRWAQTAAPTFARWQKSRPGVAGFIYTKRVEGLEAPGEYRAVVRFRWRTTSGRTVGAATRTTRVCRLRDPRPDLGIDLTARSSDGTTLRVTVANDGPTAVAGPVAVAVRHGSTTVATGSIPRLGPEATTSIDLAAPPCGPSGEYTVVVDPDDAVDEADEDDNSRTVACVT